MSDVLQTVDLLELCITWNHLHQNFPEIVIEFSDETEYTQTVSMLSKMLQLSITSQPVKPKRVETSAGDPKVERTNNRINKQTKKTQIISKTSPVV